MLLASLALACFAMVLCTVPFISPNIAFVAPTSAVSFLLLLAAMFRKAPHQAARIVVAVIVVAADLFALKLAMTNHHLIDWLEGH